MAYIISIMPVHYDPDTREVMLEIETTTPDGYVVSQSSNVMEMSSITLELAHENEIQLKNMQTFNKLLERSSNSGEEVEE